MFGDNQASITAINECLEKENAAYRVVEKQVVEITCEMEIATVEEAIEQAESSVQTHLRRALELLSDRATPDYRNSIKESVSAVESVCKTVTGDENTTLGKALKKLQKMHRMAPAFTKALSQLYGYTSEEGGIRHALTGADIEATFADAKFMLVTCTAFINYVTTVTSQHSGAPSAES